MDGNGSDVRKNMPGTDPIHSVVSDTHLSGSLRWMRQWPTFGLSQPSFVSIPPAKSATVRLIIGFTEGSPGDIRVSFGAPPAGVSVTPNSIILKTAGEQMPVQFTAALDAPSTSAPVPLTITGVAGSITHSITLDMAVAPEQ